MQEIIGLERVKLIGEISRKMTIPTLRFVKKTPFKFELKQEVMIGQDRRYEDYTASRGDVLAFSFPQWQFSPELKKHMPNVADAILAAWKIIDEVVTPYYDDAQRITRMIGKLQIDLHNLRVKWDKGLIKDEEDYRSEQLEKLKEIEKLRDRSDVLIQEIMAIETLKEHIANKIRLEAYGEDTWESLENLSLPLEDIGYLKPEVAVKI